MKPFHVLQSGIRAMERITLAESWELLGALGVAADPYPHQISNVRRILEATEIRHLIADEVGLGKTVQAMMILNTLRRRDPSLRVAIIAPERICYQWQAELSARGHVSAAIWNEEGMAEHPSGEGLVHIIRSEMIRAEPALPSPLAYDMLIVDEPHVLTLRQMTFLSSLCRNGIEESRFRHVLLLTATPRLGNAEWARAVFGIIEPDKSEIAGMLGREPQEYMLEAALAQDSDPGGTVAEATSPYSRILRQTRENWPDVAPSRRLVTRIIAPNESELARLELSSECLRLHKVGESPRLDGAPWQQIRQLFWARETVREALRHRAFSAMPELVNECVIALGRSPGDSLIEELCDALIRIWDGDSQHRVIIVAGDTPTVDMLEQRLSRLFPELANDGLIATMRGRNNTDLVDVVGAVHGGAKVLIMEEWVEAGLNLHHFADDIIFYGLPWSMSRIDQLIGRLDRLRPHGFRKSLSGKSVGNITITRLVMSGSSDERVLDAMDRMGVFAAPMPFLDDELVVRMEAVVALAAIGAPGFRKKADGLATEMYAGIEAVPIAGPKVVPTEASAGRLYSNVQTAENSAEDWLRILGGSGAFKIGWPNSMEGERVGIVNLPRLPEDCPYSIGAMTTSEGEVVRLKRGRMGQPPTKDLRLPGDRVGRRARFFSTGDQLHDDLVHQSLQVALRHMATPSARPIPVSFSVDHPATELVGSTLAISAFAWRPTTNSLSPKALIQRHGDWLCEGVQGLRTLHEGLLTGIEADLRWLDLRFPSSFRLIGTRIIDGGQREDIPTETLQAVLSSEARHRENRIMQAIIPACREAPNVFKDHDLQTRQRESERMSRLRHAAFENIAQRFECIMEEATTYTRARQINIERLEGHNITETRQRQMQQGQIATERRRMAARQQGAIIRVRTLEEMAARLGSVVAPSVIRLLIRIVPVAGESA